MQAIKKLFEVVEHNLATTAGTMDYDRLTDAIIRLSNVISETETDESTWYIGEFGEFTLADLITGAYWHYTEWHGGQWSKGYEALCALGRVFNPGMSMPETDNTAYQLLNDMAENEATIQV